MDLIIRTHMRENGVRGGQASRLGPGAGGQVAGSIAVDFAVARAAVYGLSGTIQIRPGKARRLSIQRLCAIGAGAPRRAVPRPHLGKVVRAHHAGMLLETRLLGLGCKGIVGIARLEEA